MLSKSGGANGPNRLFEIGSLTFSEAIERLMQEGRLDPMPFLQRHLRGDWGDVADYKWQENNAAVKSGGHLESFYVVHRELAISILTMPDRTATHIRASFERRQRPSSFTHRGHAAPSGRCGSSFPKGAAMTIEELSQLPQPEFPAGQIAFTPGIVGLVAQGRLDPVRYLRRHLKCDWGDQCDADWQSNDTAVRTGEDRLLSIYEIEPDLTLWILTERNRRATTLMLPADD